MTPALLRVVTEKGSTHMAVDDAYMMLAWGQREGERVELWDGETLIDFAPKATEPERQVLERVARDWAENVRGAQS